MPARGWEASQAPIRKPALEAEIIGESDEPADDEAAWYEADEAGAEPDEASDDTETEPVAEPPAESCPSDAGSAGQPSGLFDEGSGPGAHSPRAPEPARSKPAPSRRRPIRGGLGDGGAVFPLPVYLAELCSLPGVNRADFEAVDCRLAVIELWCKQPRANHDRLPVAHLAPEALEVLADMRFGGHVRAAVYRTEQDRVPLFHFAIKLPEGEVPPAAAGGDELYRVEAELRTELDRLRAERAEAAPINPMRAIKDGLNYVREVIQDVGEIKNELREISGLDLDLSSGAGRADDGDEGEGGGTLEAIIAVGMAKAQEFLGSDLAKQLGRTLLARLRGGPAGAGRAAEPQGDESRDDSGDTEAA